MIINGLYLIWKNVLANKRTHFFSVVQIILVLLLFNIVLSIVQNTKVILNHYEGSDFSRALYAAQIPTSQMREDRSAILRRLPQILDVGNEEIGILAVTGINTPKFSANLRLYSQRLLEAFSLPLSKGNWFKSNISDQGPIPVVISYDLAAQCDVGHIVSADIGSWAGTVGNQVELEIVGVLEKNSMILKGGYWATGMSLEGIYESAEKAVIMSLDRSELDNVALLYQMGFFVFVPEDKDFEETYAAWAKSLSDLATVITLKEMSLNHLEQIRYPLVLYGSILLVLFFLALGGLGGNNALALLGYRKEFSIYFACGCKWGSCVAMLIVQNLLVLIIPTATVFGILKNAPNMFNEFMAFKTSNYLYSILIVFFIFLTTSLDPLSALAKESPISIIRRCN